MKNSKLYLTGIAIILLSVACLQKTIPPTTTNCPHFELDTHTNCSLYDSIKNKWWAADSIFINGQDYTQQALNNIGGSYGFSISPDEMAMGTTGYVMAPAFIQDGLGRVVHCYWYDIKRISSVPGFPLSYCGSTTTVPQNHYLAPLPLYYNSLLGHVHASTGVTDTTKGFYIASATPTRLVCKSVFPDTVIVNIFKSY
jgi:hypothetical protein